MLTRVNRLLLGFCLFAYTLTLPLYSFAATTTSHSTSKTSKKHHKRATTSSKTTSKTPATTAATPATRSTTKTTTKKTKHGKKKAVAAAPAIPQTANVQEGIDQILSKFSRINVGVMVQSLDTGATLYQHNSNQTYMPASTLKLFTAAAALTYLGPSYTFKTQLLTNNNYIQNGVLAGDLYVRFSGDPELTIAQVSDLIATLTKDGIREIQGSLIVDDNDMDHQNMGPGWLPRWQMLCYAAPSNAVILNRNCFAITLAPGKNNGPVQVRIPQNLANLTVTNQALTRSGGAQNPLELKPTSNNNYILTGYMSPRRAPVGIGVTLNDTRAAGINVVNNLLRQHGILLHGKVYYGRVPGNVQILAEHESRPVSALVTKMLKKSDNLIAGSLFKKLGNTYFNTTGTWQNSAQAERGILEPKTGIDFSKTVIVDGSGLSRLDLISPAQFVKLLQYTYRMPANLVFYQALPISGIDGTLRGRLGGATAGKVHAKTGTVDAHSGLVGYIQTVNHQNLIFAILVDDPVDGKGNQGVYHLVEDRICQFLAMHPNLSTKPQPVVTKPAVVAPPAVPVTAPTTATKVPATNTPSN